MVDGTAYYGAILSTLAWRCASTFRQTDYLGGCNGARIRLADQMAWPENTDLDKALAVLQPIKNSFGDSLSWADLIVLAGQVAIEQASEAKLTFCGGRTDALEGDEGSAYLKPRHDYPSTNAKLRDHMKVMGLSPAEMVALKGQMRSGVLQVALNFTGTWTSNMNRLSNEYYQTLLNNTWTQVDDTDEYTARVDGTDLYMHASDLELKYDPEFAQIAQRFYLDNDLFLAEFSKAWTKVMNADRFDGPLGNVCTASDGSGSESWVGEVLAGVFGGLFVGAAAVHCYHSTGKDRTDERGLLSQVDSM
jgi:catalase (peroxidase I)